MAEHQSDVLAIYGESDIVALNAEDHKLIADMANVWQAGQPANMSELAGIEHSLTLVGNLHRNSRPGNRAIRCPPVGEFNSKVVDILAS